MIQGESPNMKNPAVTGSDFHPIIVQKENSFCVYLPEWNVSGEGPSLEEAFRQYERNKEAVESCSKKYGLAAVSPDPYPTLKRVAIFQELGLFFVKVATCAFAVILVIVLLLPNIGAAVRNQVNTLVPAEFLAYSFWAIEFPSQINERLDRLEPEKQKKMLSEWSKLLERTAIIWKPLKCQ